MQSLQYTPMALQNYRPRLLHLIQIQLSGQTIPLLLMYLGQPLRSLPWHQQKLYKN
jgi:hypothetical protein